MQDEKIGSTKIGVQDNTILPEKRHDRPKWVAYYGGGGLQVQL